LDERAVERFMKFMQAINKVNNAIEPRIYKYVRLPPAVTLVVVFARRCTSLRGVRNCFLIKSHRFQPSAACLSMNAGNFASSFFASAPGFNKKYV
jgi:hypothetical protein